MRAGHRSRDRARLVRARPGARGLRRRVRRRCRARATRSASATGTDAIALALRAIGVGPGDEVITAPVSAAFTGARDHDGRRARRSSPTSTPKAATLDPRAVEAAITPRTAAIMPVHLYGQAGGHGPLEMHRHAGTVSRSSRTRARRIWRRLTGRPVGTFGVAGAFSFYPTKNLGALGDGGAIVTNDAALADRAEAAAQRRPDRSLSPPEFGVNSRLDEMQAAVLRARLPFPARVDGAPTRAGATLSSRPRARDSRVPPERDPGTSITCSRCDRPARERYARTSNARHRHDRALSDLDAAQPVFAALGNQRRPPALAPDADRGPRLRRGLLASAASRPRPTPTSTCVAAAVNAWQPEHPSAAGIAPDAPDRSSRRCSSATCPAR